MSIVLIQLFFYLLLGALVADLFRRSAWASWIFYLLVPLGLTPVWLRLQESPFFWIKIYSCIFALCWTLLIRFTSLGTRRWPFLIAFWIFGINILEAVSSNALALDLFQWYQSNQEFVVNWLFWVKFVGASISVILLLAHRYCFFRWKAPWLYGIYTLLLGCLFCPLNGNILSGYAASWVNATAGLILIATFPPVRSLTVAQEKNRDLLWDVPWAWIWGFNLWDWVFIYHVFPSSAGRTISTLMGTVLVAWLRGRKFWIQARLYVLTFHLIFAFTFPQLIAQMDTPSWEDAKLNDCFAFLSILWMSIYYYWYTSQSRQRISN